MASVLYAYAFQHAPVGLIYVQQTGDLRYCVLHSPVSARVSRYTRACVPRDPQSTAAPAQLPLARYAVRDGASNELYTVADVRCEAFSAHAADAYLYHMRRREMHAALADRVAAGARCLVVVDRAPPSEWAPFSAQDGSIVVASLDVTLHSAAGARLLFAAASPPPGARLYVSSIAVRRAWRRRGLASRLLTEVNDIARALQVDVYLHVDSDNVAAVRLYNAHGFERADTARQIAPVWLSFLAKREYTLLWKAVAKAVVVCGE